jgi:hypothetical protein
MCFDELSRRDWFYRQKRTKESKIKQKNKNQSDYFKVPSLVKRREKSEENN